MSCVTWLPKSRIRTRSVMDAASLAGGGRGATGFRRLPASQRGDEEPVGTVPRRRQAQHGAARGRLAADRLAPDLGDRQQREVRVRREKPLDLRLVLFLQQRA